jgi:CRISPR-associated protein Cas2
MYVILVYDVESKKCGKMLKLCRKYLNWIQNSVFEGDITEVNLKRLIRESEDIIDKTSDSIIIFNNKNRDWLNKRVIGYEKAPTDQFL